MRLPLIPTLSCSHARRASLVLAVLFGGAAMLPAAEHVFPIACDAYMDSAAASNNYGVANVVRVLINSDGSSCRGLFRLPAEVAAYDAQRSRYIVGFYVFSVQTSGRRITLYPLTRDFVEGTRNASSPADGATWNTYDGTHAWTTAGGDFDTNYPVVAMVTNNWFTWDITPLMTNPPDRANLLNYGALLQIDETPRPPSGSPRAPFTSSDSSNPEKPYVRVIVASPLTLPITSDSYIDSRNATLNYGAAKTVKTVINNNVTGDGSICRGLLQLPPAVGWYPPSQLARAVVRLYVWQDNTSDRQVTLFPLTNAFVEGTGNGGDPADGATWQVLEAGNPWAQAGGDFDTNFPVIGVKEDILDPNIHDRFFHWDITALLTNETSRAELLNCGALLQIDEIPIPTNGMPRAPFTSSDDPSYTTNFRPHVQLAVISQSPAVLRAALATDKVTLGVGQCTPLLTHRVERTLDLTGGAVWTPVTNWVATDDATNWIEWSSSEWTSACYRITSDE